MSTYKRLQSFGVRVITARAPVWDLQDLLLLGVVCTRINRACLPSAHLHCPHCCNAVARRLGNTRPSLDLHCVCHTHTILAITISCGGLAPVVGLVSLILCIGLPPVRGGRAQSINKNPHKATHGQGEADPSATSRVANPASRSDTGLGGWKSQL